MKRNRKAGILNVLFFILQLAIIAGAMVLEYLSHKKMGMMRYLVFKKRVYEETLFNSQYMYVYKWLFIIGVVIGLVWIAYAMVKIKNRKIIGMILFSIILHIIGIMLIVSPYMVQLKAYHFFFIAVMMDIVIQYVRIFLRFQY